jgi:hypothetical protein
MKKIIKEEKIIRMNFYTIKSHREERRRNMLFVVCCCSLLMHHTHTLTKTENELLNHHTLCFRPVMPELDFYYVLWWFHVALSLAGAKWRDQQKKYTMIKTSVRATKNCHKVNNHRIVMQMRFFFHSLFSVIIESTQRDESARDFDEEFSNLIARNEIENEI